MTSTEQSMKDSTLKPNFEFEITPLRQGEEQLIVDLIKRNLEVFQDTGGVLATVYRRLENFKDVYNLSGSVNLVVREKHTQKCIGSAGLGPLAGLPSSEGMCEIRDLVVDRPFRGHGLGAMLLKSAVATSIGLGYKRIYLETTPQMESAQKLFKNFGFQAVRERTQDKNTSKDESFPCYFVLEAMEQAC